MQSACTLWSPVIMARFEKPRSTRKLSIASIDQVYSSIEELKVKIKQSQASMEGHLLETRVNVEILCLLQKPSGAFQLISKEDMLKDRVALDFFNKQIDLSGRVNFVVDIVNNFWQAEIAGGELQVTIFLDYTVIATREQEVTLSSLTEPNFNQSQALLELLKELEQEVQRLQEENRGLQHQVIIYEKNIGYLKKAVYKAEKSNEKLVKELRLSQEQIGNLQQMVQAQEKFRQRYQEEGRNRELQVMDQGEDKSANLGQKIKRLFMNN